MSVKYKRVLLKVSGEALEDKADGQVFSEQMLKGLADQIGGLVKLGVQVIVVVGAGNIMRGGQGAHLGMPQAEADDIGMLGTVINSLAIKGTLEKEGIKAKAFSSFEALKPIAYYTRREALEALGEGEVVIVGGGTGNPFFTTDSAAALRALELDAQAILMAKNGVDGVYTADPNKDRDAKLIKKTTYREILTLGLKVMDATAAGLLLNSKVVTRVFSMKPENFAKVIGGEDLGTVITA